MLNFPVPTRRTGITPRRSCTSSKNRERDPELSIETVRSRTLVSSCGRPGLHAGLDHRPPAADVHRRQRDYPLPASPVGKEEHGKLTKGPRLEFHSGPCCPVSLRWGLSETSNEAPLHPRTGAPGWLYLLENKSRATAGKPRKELIGSSRA